MAGAGQAPTPARAIRRKRYGNVPGGAMDLSHSQGAPLPLIAEEIPARQGGDAVPTLVLLHGRGADETDLLPLAEALDPRYRYVSLRAPWPLPGYGYAWYGMDSIGTPEPESFQHSLKRLAEWIGRNASGLLVACGFSQGAVVALALLAAYPERVAAAAMLSGYLAADPAPTAGRPVFVAHGRSDPVIPVGLARQARQRLEEAGARVTYHEYPMGHTTCMEEIAVLRAWLGERIRGDGPGSRNSGEVQFQPK
jgi:phospholipase/carboxylesterase